MFCILLVWHGFKLIYKYALAYRKLKIRNGSSSAEQQNRIIRHLKTSLFRNWKKPTFPVHRRVLVLHWIRHYDISVMIWLTDWLLYGTSAQFYVMRRTWWYGEGTSVLLQWTSHDGITPSPLTMLSRIFNGYNLFLTGMHAPRKKWLPRRHDLTVSAVVVGFYYQ